MEASPLKRISGYDRFPDTRQSRNDTCLFASTSALLTFLGYRWTEDFLQLYLKQGSFEGVRAMVQAERPLSKLVGTVREGTPEQIIAFVKGAIDEDTPVLLSKGANVEGDHAHIVVALGYDDEGLIVHDPGHGKGTRFSYDQLSAGPHALKRDFLTITLK